MRVAALTLAAAIGLTAAAVSANAAPAIPHPTAPQASNIVLAAGGCGWGFHRNYRGFCVPNRRPYYRPYGYYRPQYRPYTYYYGGGYGPPYGPSPSDHVANQLNRQELGRGYWGY